MKNFKNTFIIWVILLIVIIIFSQVYRAYSSNANDTNTYLSLVKGKATIDDNFINIWKEHILSAGNIVRTIWQDSLAVIEWWDGSITRLGGNTKISVGSNEVSRDYTQINISFDLIAGKTWSNVVSFIAQDSSFTQTFKGVEAWVRGTVFDVDLEQWFINVTDHQVNLKDIVGAEYIIGENKPFSLESLSFIEFSEFIRDLRDADWTELNKNLDTEFLSNLKAEIDTHLASNNPFLFLLEVFSPKYRFLYELEREETDFQTLKEMIESLSDAQKQDVHDIVLSRYQKLNFIDANDDENYQKKLLYKRLLILLSDVADKERLLETSLFDFKDTISTQNIQAYNTTLELLNENQDILKELDIEGVLWDINLIPDDLEKILQENFEWIREFFEGGLPDLWDLDFQDAKTTAEDTLWDAGKTLSELEGKAQDTINEWLDNLFESFSN